MFSVTFIGHQGWLFQTERTSLLVDPLLCEEFGQAHALGYRVYPPRTLKLEEFPAISAVVLTHEHDDHFDIPSLHKLDRRIPIFLSARSSSAAVAILRQMGFSVQPLRPGIPLGVGDLEMLPLCGDHIHTNSSDEWDTLPFLIRDTGGSGSFFSMVDCTLTPGHVELVRAFHPRPGLVGWTNNELDWSHMSDFVAERSEGTVQFTQTLLAAHYLLSSIWGTPAAMLLCGGGFAFSGPREWLNRRVFCIEPERVCKALKAAYPNQRFFATRPGQTFHMEKNSFKRSENQRPFLATPPAESWPARVKTAMPEFPDYAPATAKTTLEEQDLERLQKRLSELARALVQSSLFRSLYSILDAELDGRAPTFAFVLRSGEKRNAWVFAYNPNACGFDLVPTEDPRAAYLAGMECWATDLLAVLGGELGPIALNFGRAWFWNALPKRFQFDLGDALNSVSHPLSRPSEYLRTYERLLGNCAAVDPTASPPIKYPA